MCNNSLKLYSIGFQVLHCKLQCGSNNIAVWEDRNFICKLKLSARKMLSLHNAITALLCLTIWIVANYEVGGKDFFYLAHDRDNHSAML